MRAIGTQRQVIVEKLQKENNRKNRISICIVYCGLFALFMFKMFFYGDEIINVPDQPAQLSYVVYMEKNPHTLIPKFEDIGMYEIADTVEDGNHTKFLLEETGETCYLGHPPFYYKFMQLCHVIEINGDQVLADMTRIAYINILVTSLTMILILSIGYAKLTELRAGLAIHFMYATICTGLPLYGYLGSGINNDNFCNVGLVVFLLGLISYFDRGYCYTTYWMIALGVLISMFSKLTAGWIVVVTSAVLILFAILKDRNLKIICNKYFVTTIPLYLIVLAYFIRIYTTYGSVQPGYGLLVSAEEYMSSDFYVAEELRTHLTMAQDMVSFLKNMLDTWMATYETHYFVARKGVLAFPFLLVLAAFLVSAAVSIYRYIRRKEFNIETISFAFAVAIATAILRQYRGHWSSYLANGYTGGYQARYYMPCLPVIALCVSRLTVQCGNRLACKWRKAGDAVIVILCCLMIYADFFYYVTAYYKV
jgi:hypothetical protein